MMNKQKGFVKIIIIFIVVIMILSFLGVDIRGFLNSPLVKDNFSYVWGGAVNIWNTYIADSVKAVIDFGASIMEKSPQAKTI